MCRQCLKVGNRDNVLCWRPTQIIWLKKNQYKMMKFRLKLRNFVLQTIKDVVAMVTQVIMAKHKFAYGVEVN